MPSTINADNGVSSGSAGLKSAADASGVLQLQTNGTTALAVSTSQVVTLTNALPTGSGGTGVTGTPTNGQLLIGNGTGYTLGTLTQGSGVTVTNGAGSITVANAGVTSLAAGTGISVSGSTGAVTVTNSSPMTYPGSGIPNSTGSAWGTSYSTTGGGTVVQLGRRALSVISTNTAAAVSTTYVLTASLTLTLPTSPTAGDWVMVANLSGTTTAIVARNGQNIMSLAEDMTINAANASFTLTFADATRGWVLTL